MCKDGASWRVADRVARTVLIDLKHIRTDWDCMQFARRCGLAVPGGPRLSSDAGEDCAADPTLTRGATHRALVRFVAKPAQIGRGVLAIAWDAHSRFHNCWAANFRNLPRLHG